MQLTPDIHWIGHIDWDVRDFHSFDTWRGATYNSYLIQDEKTAVIDAVKFPYAENQLRQIRRLTDLGKVDYVVCNHAEPDHAGSVAELLAALPNATLLCNDKCRDALGGYFSTANWKIQEVTPETTIPLGKNTLRFINTPMVHWPESMFTYVPEEQILFSMDAFGQHIATSERFDDQYDLPSILQEAKTYYANIVTPYGAQVLKTLAAAATLPMKMLATSHGLIWRKHITAILESYKNWASGTYAPKVLILYDTMWDSTKKLAEAILEGAVQVPGADVQLIHVRHTSMTRIATEMLDAAAVALGSPTLNMQPMPQMSAVMTYVKGLRFAPKAAVAFGSFGWAQGGASFLDKWIDDNKWERAAELITSRFRPADSELEKAAAAGKILAETALKKAGKLEGSR